VGGSGEAQPAAGQMKSSLSQVPWPSAAGTPIPDSIVNSPAMDGYIWPCTSLSIRPYTVWSWQVKPASLLFV
jgi:hypothetical protein